MKKKIYLLSLVLLLASCGTTEISSSKDESESIISDIETSSVEEVSSKEEASSAEEVSSEVEETSSEEAVDRGRVLIKNMTVYKGNSAKQINVTFTKEEYAEELTYEYDNSLISIEDGYVTALKMDVSVIVKASSEHFKTQFTVRCGGVGCQGSAHNNFLESVTQGYNYYIQQQKDREVEEGSTMFIGDSFFDNRYFWTHFYDEVQGNVFDAGISSSTIVGWQCYAEHLIYDIAPANIVMHLGSNDFWDLNHNATQVATSLKELVEDIHENLPEAKIYCFGVENRTYTMGGSTSAQSIAKLVEFEQLATEYAADKDYVTFIPTLDHFTNEDKTANNNLFKDGVHPIDSQYKFYIQKLFEAGLTDITYNDYTQLPVADFSTKITDTWGTTSKTIYSKGQALSNQFVMSGTLSFNFNTYDNAHIGFEFSNDINNRFLLWNSMKNGNLYFCGAFQGTYYNTSVDYVTYPTTTSVEWKVLVSENNAYLFINGKLEVVYLNLHNTGEFLIATEYVAAEFTNNVIHLKGDGSNAYEALLTNSNVAYYENLSLTNKTKIYYDFQAQ